MNSYKNFNLQNKTNFNNLVNLANIVPISQTQRGGTNGQNNNHVQEIEYPEPQNNNHVNRNNQSNRHNNQNNIPNLVPIQNNLQPPRDRIISTHTTRHIQPNDDDSLTPPSLQTLRQSSRSLPPPFPLRLERYPPGSSGYAGVPPPYERQNNIQTPRNQIIGTPSTPPPLHGDDSPAFQIPMPLNDSTPTRHNGESQESYLTRIHNIINNRRFSNRSNTMINYPIIRNTNIHPTRLTFSNDVTPEPNEENNTQTIEGRNSIQVLDDFVRAMKGQSSSSTATLPPGMDMNDIIRRINEMNESTRCNICLENRKDTYLLPCHHEFCKKCATNIRKRDNKCPNCREYITGNKKRFL